MGKKKKPEPEWSSLNRPARLRNTPDAIGKTVAIREAIEDYRAALRLRSEVDLRLIAHYQPGHLAADLMVDERQMVVDRLQKAEVRLICMLDDYTAADVAARREPGAPPWERSTGVSYRGMLYTTTLTPYHPEEDDDNRWLPAVIEEDERGTRLVQRLVMTVADCVVDLDDCQF